jgi:hypothetical protein
MNSFSIVQSEKQTQLAVSVHRNAEIESIRLARAKAFAVRPKDGLKEPIVLSVDVKAKEAESSVGSLMIEVLFRVTGIRKSDGPKSTNSICVECVFEVEYRLREGFKPTPDQIKAFKDGNAIFNCWPYGRQHAQDMMARLGYPPLTLPFLRVQTARKLAQRTLKGK